uniref:Uncharacterized protein n=1 Tax=Arundo donax TaxID=35708 RepID=A0A0A8YGY5_ARUDO
MTRSCIYFHFHLYLYIRIFFWSSSVLFYKSLKHYVGPATSFPAIYSTIYHPIVNQGFDVFPVRLGFAV